MKKLSNKFRNPDITEIEKLQNQGCRCEDWATFWLSDPLSINYIFNASFYGEVFIGSLGKEIIFPGGLRKKSGLYNVTLHNCCIGDNVYISETRNHISNYDISNDTVIENINLLIMDGESSFGNGTLVNVLDETGGRQLMIYDRLSAHLAYIMAFYRHIDHLPDSIEKMIKQYSKNMKTSRGFIGRNCEIRNCNEIINVKIGDYTRINGASLLKEGSINSNSYSPVKIGLNTIAENFIISSGAEINNGAIIFNCFVGQGCLLSNNYSATNSLFFSNCQGINGEACSVFAGPFTVTHHKSTLLIAGMFSFLNAGSGSNQSNHMYKLGPIHHGIVERGSKTTSDSYLLWPAKIGPFTLVMGRHYKNSDTSFMPFSYLIEKNDESWLVPGINLRSVGTIRDAMKWPRRDKRTDPDLLDCINYNLLSPYTVERMLKGKKILEDLRNVSGDSCDVYSWGTVNISGSSLTKGIDLYNMAISKFLGNSIITRIENKLPSSKTELLNALIPESDNGHGEWIDIAGLIAPKKLVQALINGIDSGNILTLSQFESELQKIHNHYYEYEWEWVASNMECLYGKKIRELGVSDIIFIIKQWKDSVIKLDKLLYEDARKEFRLSAKTGFGIDGDQTIKEQDFYKVRGSFEDNTFVKEISEHINKKSALGDKIIGYLENLK